MSNMSYYANTNSPIADAETAGRVAGRVESARSGAGAPGSRGNIGAPAADSAEAVLQRVVSGLQGGAGLRAFRAGIEAGHRVLGNRIFLRWMVELQAVGRERETHIFPAQGLQGPERSVEQAAPLQLMPKKRKKQGAAAHEAGLEVKAEAGVGAGPGTEVEAETEVVGGVLSVSGGQSRAEAPLPQEQPEKSAGPGQKRKKKKKTRVQVALKTLRGEGLEAFRGYIEAEISEVELLRTLVERIMRAEDLWDVRDAALRVTRERAGVLDPEAGPVTQQAVATGHGQVTEKAVAVPVKSDLNQNEWILFECCDKGDVSTLRRLLRHENIDINTGSIWGTPLCFAAYHGQAVIVRELLSEPGIDINLAFDNGSTPLYLAAQQGHMEVVKLLLAASGIKVNLATGVGATPLCVAAEEGRVEVVKLLLAAPGININTATSDDRTTPLGIAAYSGYEDVVGVLLDAPNFDIDVRKHSGATPLYLATQENFPRIVEQLVKRGADVNLAMNDGSTPLCAAADRGHVEIVRTLLQAPAIEINLAIKEGATALTFASQEGHKEIIRLLLRKGADPNLAHNSGMIPLHFACLHGHTAVVEMLLRAGPDTDIKAVEGMAKARYYTVYRIAELAGHREVMSVLAAHRRRREEEQARFESLPPCLRPQGLPLGDEPGSATPPMAQPEAVSLPVAVAGTQAEQTCPTSPEEIESQITGKMESPHQATVSATSAPPSHGRSGAAVSETEAVSSPLAQVQDALRQEVLGKLRGDNLEPLQGIRLLEDVNASTDMYKLCTLYNRLARIERQKERARRRGRRQEVLSVAAGPAALPAPVFSLGERTGLDAEAVEDEIKRHLAQRYHRFVGQAVNDMEFGRGKRTPGYRGLWHASAGVEGVGSCSVFYYLDGSGEQIRVVGTGHHLGRAAYRLDYAAEGSGLGGRILHIA